MIFLFSTTDGPLKEGADFMKNKNSALHPGLPGFYLGAQKEPTHQLVGRLGPDTDFDKVPCQLTEGESAIIIGHGGDNKDLYDEARKDVTDAAIRLLKKIALDNVQRKAFNLFLAACGGGLRQPGGVTALLPSLVGQVPELKTRLGSRTITCGSYGASAGLVNLPKGVPNEYLGTHIFGILEKNKIEQHCGYDRAITTILSTADGKFVTIHYSQALYPLHTVIQWAQTYTPPMKAKFPNLYQTLERTS